MRALRVGKALVLLALTANAVLFGIGVARPGFLRDFLIIYVAARLGRNQGWDRLYDADRQRILASAVQPEWHHFFPFVSAPPVAWMALPLSGLPFGAAGAIWLLLLAFALAGCWYLMAPGDGGHRLWHLALLASSLPVMFCLLVGQIVPVVMLCLTLTWHGLRGGRQLVAGLALGAGITLKPQLILLVPLALLLSASWGALAGAALSGGLLALLSLLVVGLHGATAAVAALGTVRGLNDPSLDLGWAIGRGPALGVRAAVLILVAAICLRWRRVGPERPLAAAVIGSLLVSPYLHDPDLAILVLAGWLTLRTAPHWSLVALLATTYLASWAVASWEAESKVLYCELGWLILLATTPPALRRSGGFNRLTALPFQEGQPAGAPFHPP